MSSSFSQCQGTNKQNTQCGRDWGLDARGFCERHRSQAPTSPSQPCRGTTKNGDPCKIVRDLDTRGYCSYHGNQDTAAAPPTATASGPHDLQCRGTSKKGVRCAITWRLHDDVMCKYHTGRVPQCHGVLAPDGRRCSATVGVDRFGFCTDHGHNDAANDASSAALVASNPTPSHLANDRADDDDANTSVEWPSDDTDAEDHDETKPPVDTRDLPALGMVLLFEKVTCVRDAKVRWMIKDAAFNAVVEQGPLLPGVARLLSTVRAGSDAMRQLRLVVAVDDKKNGSVESEPHSMDALRPSGKVNISFLSSVKVHLVPVEAAAP